METRIKDIYLNALNESKNDFFYLSEDVIGDVNDVNYNKEDDYIKIDFTTTYGKKLSFIGRLADFKKWFTKNQDNPHVFFSFLKDFFENSEETEQIHEIIDDYGNILPNNDLPDNATNRLVGTTHVMDLEKIFKRSMPKSVRNYSGNLGLGVVVW